MNSRSIAGPFPFIVEQRCDRDRRIRLDQFIADAALNDAVGKGMARQCGLHQDTPLNAKQREAVLDVARTTVARRPYEPICIVWSPSDCTYVTADGPEVSGDRPPKYDVEDPRDWDEHPFDLVDCWTIELAAEVEGSSHLSLRLIGTEYVEVSTASPCHVASLEDEGPFGSADPYERFCDADGELRVPKRFRGVEITGYNETFPMLYGPLQPDGSVVRVVPRWPGDVFRACREIVGDVITEKQLIAAWVAVAPTSDDTNHIGILRAA